MTLNSGFELRPEFRIGIAVGEPIWSAMLAWQPALVRGHLLNSDSNTVRITPIAHRPELRCDAVTSLDVPFTVDVHMGADTK